jgi:hypothetical protein
MTMLRDTPLSITEAIVRVPEGTQHAALAIAHQVRCSFSPLAKTGIAKSRPVTNTQKLL